MYAIEGCEFVCNYENRSMLIKIEITTKRPIFGHVIVLHCFGDLNYAAHVSQLKLTDIYVAGQFQRLDVRRSAPCSFQKM